MTQPQRVLYLPPGVAPVVTSPQQQAAPSSLPFDRAFFEHVLAQSVQAYCGQTECSLPVVELMTVDGATHFVNGIVGVADQWVALQTSSEAHDHVVQVFLPYATIFRVEVHPSPDPARNHLGFWLESVQDTAPEAAPGEIAPATTVMPAETQGKRAIAKARTKAKK